MNQEIISQKKPKGLEMYFSEKVAKQFAELEQNEKNFNVAEIVDAILMQETKTFKTPIRVAELGGGAHPDRYHEFFNRLLRNPKNLIDWVDVSPIMLKLAKKYLLGEKFKNRKKIITFIKADILEYLKNLPEESLDLAIMKYTIDHIKALEELFSLLNKKLKTGGKLIAVIGNYTKQLESRSTNASHLLNGKPISKNESRLLKDGDNFTLKFFKKSNDPDSGYLEGAEVLKYFHSENKIKKLAKLYHFNLFLGDWKDIVMLRDKKLEKLDQKILVLTKK